MSWASILEDAQGSEEFSHWWKLTRRAAVAGPAPGEALRVLLLGEVSLELVAPLVGLALAERGLSAEVEVAPYGSALQRLHELAAGAAQGPAPDLVVAHLVAQRSPLMTESPPQGWDATLDAHVEELLAASEAVRASTGAEVVLQTLAPLAERAWGHAAPGEERDPNVRVRRFNAALAQAATGRAHVWDLAGLVERVGLERWFDARHWFDSRQAVAPELLPRYARELSAVLAALRGRSKKLLVLDLDNTLWGGEVGELGPLGIELGEGSAQGEAYKHFQSHLLRLQQRGVLLAVCSKNEEANARAPFEQHPECVLGLEHFAAFRANWEPKSDNVQSIAAELGLPLSACVFVDDQPAECEQVRLALPEVLVLGGDDAPLGLLRELERSHAFEPGRLSGEDLRRGELYAMARQGRELERRSADLEGFLRSLEMRVQLRPLDEQDLERVTQLVNKTNQYNLTGERMTAGQVREYATGSAQLGLTGRLSDRFGDHGLVAAALAHVEGSVLCIDAWVMSCRVLGRGLQCAMGNELARIAHERGLEGVRGRFRSTGRNQPARDHYSALGFERCGEEDWALDLASFEPREHFLALEAVPPL